MPAKAIISGWFGLQVLIPSDEVWAVPIRAEQLRSLIRRVFRNLSTSFIRTFTRVPVRQSGQIVTVGVMPSNRLRRHEYAFEQMGKVVRLGCLHRELHLM